MYVLSMLGAILVSTGLFWAAFAAGITAMFAVGGLLLAWATVSMFAGRALLLERDNRREG